MTNEEKRIKRNEYMKQYYHKRKTDPKFMEDRRISRAKEKEKHREKNRAYNRIYSKRWRTAHPEWLKELRMGGYAKKKGVVVGKANYEGVFERWDGNCGICKEVVEGKYHYDHIIPLNRGGAHLEENIQITHPRCNRVKYDKVLAEVGV